MSELVERVEESKTEYIISEWPADLKTLPHSVFKKNTDGTWTIAATLIVSGNVRMTNFTVGGDSSEARVIDAALGKAPT